MGDISYYDISDDISDSQCNEIYESYLTSSQFVDMFSDWSERDKLENDWIKSRNFWDIDCSESDREINDILEGWSQGDSFSQSDIVEGWSQGDSFSQSDSNEVEQEAESDKEQGEETVAFKNKQIKGGSYIKTPRRLRGKVAILNVKNFDDNLCFIYCILAFLYPATNNVQRVKKYKKHIHKLKYKGIKMPMAVKDIEKFEKINNLIINVYACQRNEWGDYEIEIRRISKKRGEAINLLMIEDGGRYHYTLIKDLNRLMRSRGDRYTKEFCPFCLLGFDKRIWKECEKKERIEECFKKGGMVYRKSIDQWVRI